MHPQLGYGDKRGGLFPAGCPHRSTHGDFGVPPTPAPPPPAGSRDTAGHGSSIQQASWGGSGGPRSSPLPPIFCSPLTWSRRKYPGVRRRGRMTMVRGGQQDQAPRPLRNRQRARRRCQQRSAPAAPPSAHSTAGGGTEAFRGEPGRVWDRGEPGVEGRQPPACCRGRGGGGVGIGGQNPRGGERGGGGGGGALVSGVVPGLSPRCMAGGVLVVSPSPPPHLLLVSSSPGLQKMEFGAPPPEPGSPSFPAGRFDGRSGL